MNYSKPEWLLIIFAFGLSVAANLSAESPLTPGALLLVLLAIMSFALVRYVPLAVVIAISLLLVGSGTPSMLAGHFQIGEWIVLMLIGLVLLLSLGAYILKLHDQDEPSESGASQSVQTLFRVVDQGNIAWTHRLIAMGADVNVRNEDGETPLMRAAAKGYADMVQVLLQHGANPGLHNGRGESALTIALMRGYTRIAESLKFAGHGMPSGREQDRQP
jgi:hypothetical protein